VASKIFAECRKRALLFSLCAPVQRKEEQVKISEYKSYDELPLFLNAATVAKVLGVSPSSGYELMHEADFPVLKVGSRMVVPKEKFVEWVEQHIGGGNRW
jgi:excisionase family DNA binding protein